MKIFSTSMNASFLFERTKYFSFEQHEVMHQSEWVSMHFQEWYSWEISCWNLNRQGVMLGVMLGEHSKEGKSQTPTFAVGRDFQSNDLTCWCAHWSMAMNGKSLMCSKCPEECNTVLFWNKAVTLIHTGYHSSYGQTHLTVSILCEITL